MAKGGHGMSKLRCICGYIIRDQTDNLPYKAHFIPDEDQNPDIEAVTADVMQFMAARDRGDQGAFIREHLGGAWPDDENPETILYILLTGVIMRSGRLMYECENCGRLWVMTHAEYGKQAFFACYRPESEKRRVLRSLRQDKSREDKKD